MAKSRGAREQATLWLRPFHRHLRFAGLGSISEIFDGDEPHTPRGCIAQARSVAELAPQIIYRELSKRLLPTAPLKSSGLAECALQLDPSSYGFNFTYASAPFSMRPYVRRSRRYQRPGTFIQKILHN